MKIKIGDKVFDVDFFERDGKLIISVNGKEFCFEEKEREKKVFEVKIPKRDYQEKKLFAPLPGQISKIFKREGEKVQKGEKILSLFAMKMENEIEAETEGEIVKILVKEGEQVKKGQALVILK